MATNQVLLPASTRSTQPVEIGLTDIQLAAARLYGLGLTRPQVARKLERYLIPRHALKLSKRDRYIRASNKLRSWESSQKFRDMVWENAVIKTDIRTGQILEGVFSKAKTGRVDAARLLLEITGRHDPKGETHPTNIAIVVDGIPRPVQAAPDTTELAESEVRELASGE